MDAQGNPATLGPVPSPAVTDAPPPAADPAAPALLPAEPAAPSPPPPAPVLPAPDDALQAEPATSATSHPSKLPAYILWGAGGASLIVGAIFGVSALNAKSDFNDNPTFKKADSVEDRAMVADITLGLGIVLAVTGTFFFFDEDSGETDTKAAAHKAGKKHGPSFAFAPLLSPTSGGAAATLKF